MERGHPVRQRAQHAQPHRAFVQRPFALRAQADRMSALHRPHCTLLA
jgi:hypothetical protein